MWAMLAKAVCWYMDPGWLLSCETGRRRDQRGLNAVWGRPAAGVASLASVAVCSSDSWVSA